MYCMNALSNVVLLLDPSKVRECSGELRESRSLDFVYTKVSVFRKD